MADQISSPNSKSLFTSQKFKFLSSKITPFDSDFSLISPTSILEANSSIFSSKSPNKPTSRNTQRFQPPDAYGLADLVKHRDNTKKPHVNNNKMVLFGSKLRIQIPSAGSACMRYPCQGQGQHISPCLQSKVLTVDEIDQTEEDYTRVISHGPNPTITHIFDNSVLVETSPCSVLLPPLSTKETKKTKDNFLSYCYTCNKNLDHKHDIYIYRGEKGFCSSECRYQEMLLDHMDI